MADVVAVVLGVNPDALQAALNALGLELRKKRPLKPKIKVPRRSQPARGMKYPTVASIMCEDEDEDSERTATDTE